MSSDESNQPLQPGDPTDSSVTEYQALSTTAVVGLLVGVLGLAAFLGPKLYVIPLAGVVLSVTALVRIAKKSPALVGRLAAVIGLIVSLTCLSVAPSYYLTSRWLLRREAKQFAAGWFQFLAQGQPHKSHQLSQPTDTRPPLDERLWDVYVEHPEQIKELEGFLDETEVRTLLALGEKAQVRYYATERQWREQGNDRAYLVHAVTYDAGGTKTSFFVGLGMERIVAPGIEQPYWYIYSVVGGITPKALKELKPRG